MTTAATPSTSAVTHVTTIGIAVADQERARAFYTGALGFSVGLDLPFAPGRRWLEVEPPGGGTTIALVATGSAPAASGDTGIRLASSDARADHARLRALGADVDAALVLLPGVPPMFTLRDPDGNELIMIEVPPDTGGDGARG